MSKIASKTIAVVVTLLLAISFMVTGAFAQSVSRFAANAATADRTIATGVTNRVKYGHQFGVAAGSVTVKAPGGTYAQTDGENSVTLDGTTPLAADATVTATQVGVYEVTYAAGMNGKYASYTYNVESYMEHEYLFVVDGNGSAIPTYWAKDGTAIRLPSATLYYYDDVTEKYLPDPDTDNVEIFCRVTKPGTAVAEHDVAALSAGVTVTPDATGTYFFTYYAKVSGGDNLFSQEYTMQVQSSFSDTQAPSLTISDVASTSSTNIAISLPTATVSDDYDSRVNTTITVQHDYGTGYVNVPEVAVDKDTGYAEYDSENRALYYRAGTNGARYEYNADGTLATTTNVAEAAPAIFDNSNFMSFYPTENGSYRVTYSAQDSTGLYDDSPSNRTTAYVYTINVSDTTAPVFNRMNESLIPSTWGRSVFKYSEDRDTETDGGRNSERVENTDIQFPIPELYDNSSSEDELVVLFTLSDKNSRTVMSFNNIYSTVASEGRYAATGDFSKTNPDRTYYFFRYWLSETDYTVDETTGKITGGDLGDNAYSLIYYDEDIEDVTKGFFNFSLWGATDSLGQYTATYRVSDASGNRATRTYNINLQNRFEDVTLPSVDFETPEYFAFRTYESEQSITDVSATDTNDARLDVEYYIVFNHNAIPDDSGEYAFDEVVVPENMTEWMSDAYLANSTTPALVELDPSLGTNTLALEKDGDRYTMTVDNREGDEKIVSVATGSTVFVAMRATDSAGNTSDYIKAVAVVDGTTAAGKTYAPVFGNVNTANGNVGQEYNFGSFYIAYADIADRNYTGFELYVQRVQNADGADVENSPLTNVSFETYSDNGEGNSNKLHVDNIRFTPSRSGKYMIVVRGFHVSGASSVAMFFRDVDGTDSNLKPGSAVLGDQLNYNTTYSLPDEYMGNGDWAGETVGVLRSITGGRFTLMGTEFTAKATTTYSFKDYTFEYCNNNGTIGEIATREEGEVNIGTLVEYNYADHSQGVYFGKSLDESNLIANENESKGNYTSTFTDSQTATFHLLGVMPTYTEITKTENGVPTYGFVKLPNISASSVNGNATDITCEVTDPDGVSVEVYEAGDTLPTTYEGDALVGNEFLFEATTDGTYTVTYTATLNNQSANVSYTIRAGDVTAPTFTTGIGYVNDIHYASDKTVSASVNDTFDFSAITVTEEISTTDFSYSKRLITPENETLAEVTSASRRNNGSSYTFTLSGTYQVVYEVTDAAGNTTTQNFYITVTSSSSNVSTEAIMTLTIVLIVVGVILIAGILIYLIRFRKRKSVAA